jgi:hypothetical protein
MEEGQNRKKMRIGRIGGKREGEKGEKRRREEMG